MSLAELPVLGDGQAIEEMLIPRSGLHIEESLQHALAEALAEASRAHIERHFPVHLHDLLDQQRLIDIVAAVLDEPWEVAGRGLYSVWACA